MYQDLVAAYDQPTKNQGKEFKQTALQTLTSKLHVKSKKLAQLGRPSGRRQTDLYFVFRHGASNGTGKTIIGGLEHLLGVVCRSLENYV